VYNGADGSRYANGEVWSIDHAQPVTIYDGRAVPYRHSVGTEEWRSIDCTSSDLNAFEGYDYGYVPKYVETYEYTDGPPSVLLRPIVSSQTTYCDGSTPRTAEPGNRVYVVDLDPTKAIDMHDPTEMSVFPAVTTAVGTGTGYNFRHYLEGTTAVAPNIMVAQPYYAGTTVRQWGSTLRVAPNTLGYVDLYSDYECTTPVIYAGAAEDVPGRLYSRFSQACTQVNGVPAPEAGLWKVPAGATSWSAYTYRKQGDGCVYIGMFAVTALTNISSEVETLLPAAPLATF
jgi:hypothetical protein